MKGSNKIAIGIVLLLIMSAIVNAKNLQEIQTNSLQPGSKAPDFILYDLYTNEAITLGNYDNKLLLIDMMASWCSPCKESTPALKHAYDEINNTDIFDILTIGIDLEDPELDLKQFHSEYGITWPMAKDYVGAINGNETFHSKYRYSDEYTYGVPNFYLVSNGTVVWTEVAWLGSSYGNLSAHWMYGNITQAIYDLNGIKIDIEITLGDTSNYTQPTEASSSTPVSNSDDNTNTNTVRFEFVLFPFAVILIFRKRGSRA